jgi:hypothetical protein
VLFGYQVTVLLRATSTCYLVNCTSACSQTYEAAMVGRSGSRAEIELLIGIVAVSTKILFEIHFRDALKTLNPLKMTLLF